MNQEAVRFLHKMRPELKDQPVGLSFLHQGHIVYTNEVVYKSLGYNKASDVFLHPFMLSPELQPCGQLSSTKAMLMIKKARVLGQHEFDWVHAKSNKQPVHCRIHLFDIAQDEDKTHRDLDTFAIWQFK